MLSFVCRAQGTEENRGVCGVTDDDTHTLLINATHRSECTHVHDKLVYVL